ncbi:MAG: amino acid adenylation domain-containing protein [Ferruginibacter sp.]
MNIPDFIGTLNKSNFTLIVEDDKLILKGDKKNLSKEELATLKKNDFIINYIRDNKAELINYINTLAVAEPVEKRAKNITAIYRLSGLQQGMLFHGLYDQGVGAYIEQFKCDLTGVDLEILNQSWDHIIESHSILRTSFNYDAFKVPVQCVHRTVKLPIVLLDFSKITESERAAKLDEYEATDRTTEFDFKVAPLMRLSLIKLDENKHRMIWTSHHILFDGWSLPILMREFLTAFEQLKSGDPLAHFEEDRFEDYIRYIDRIDKVAEESYWRNYLKGIEYSTMLPFIGVAADRNKGLGKYQTLRLILDTSTTGKINQFAQRQRLTVNTLIQGVWSYLLHQYTGNSDVVFGVTVSGRPSDLPGVEHRVGMYINALPFHSVLMEEQNIVQWLQDIQAGQVNSRQYQFTPLQQLQSWAGIHGDWFDTMMTFENFPVNKMLGSKEWSLKVENIHFIEHTNYPLNVIIESAEEINVSFSFNKALLDEVQVSRIRGHFENVLLQIIANEESDIAGLKLLTTAEKQQLLGAFNNTTQEYPQEQTISSLFEAQVLKTPEAVAVLFEGNKITYQELNERSSQLAHYLVAKGIGKDILVPICIERGIEMLIGLLGILKTGAAFVPVDPEYPEDRINYMLHDAGAAIAVSSAESSSKITNAGNLEIIKIDSDWPLISNQPSGNPGIAVDPHQLAYTIYTSGSTGKPKGVMIEHTSVVNLLFSIAKEVQFNAGSVFMSVTTFSFDICYLELFMPLALGGKLVVLSREDAMDGFRLSGNIAQHHPTHIQGTPSTWQLLLDATWENNENVKMLVGGEAVKEDLKKILTKKGDVWNVYGPTETTIWSTIKKLEYNEAVLIGKPVANTHIQIVNQLGELVPVGVAGEILLGGKGMARGYYKRPELTAEKFITDNNYSNAPGAKMYRTGDLGRWLDDGNIECLGRIDEQVKIRGYRIELGEIETVLLQSGMVRQSVVVAKEDLAGNKRLVGYIVPHSTTDKQAIIAYLRTKLPDYMVPALWIELETLPLTPNGKINKKALPDPDNNDLAETEYLAARNEQEAYLVKLWQDLLNIERVGVNDNFFVLGGHSLLAMRLVSLIRKELELDIPIKTIFTYSTIATLSAQLQSVSNVKETPDVTVQVRPAFIPLSFSQERLWYIDRLEGSVQYHMPAVLRLTGTINKAALAHTLISIISRHEVLRSVMIEKDGKPFQEVMEASHWKLIIQDGSRFQTDPAGLVDFIEQLKTVPFDLSKDYMLRAHLIVLSESEHLLMVNMHHIAADGWSISILVNEVVTLYNAFENGNLQPLPPLPLQYADYALWQRNYLEGKRMESGIAYWKSSLEGVAPLQLPTDFARPAIQTSRGSFAGFDIPLELTDQLYTLSNAQNATLFMTLLAAFKVLLYRYSGQQDICVGSPIANRPQQELEGLIGFFINTLALRSNLQGNLSFIECLQQVKQTTLKAYEHQVVPFEKVVEEVAKERDNSRSPLFQVLFVLQNTPEVKNINLGNLTLSEQPFSQNTAKFELSLYVTETKNGLHGSIEYNTDLYRLETIEHMIAHYTQLLAAVVAQPKTSISILPMLNESEINYLLHDLNNTGVKYPGNKTIIDLIEEQVATTPHSTAIIFENETLTYAELNERANQLAHHLKSLGVQEETLVPVCMERGINMMVGILGILKSGASYVPIDREYPAERINYMLQDTAAKFVVTSKQSRSSIAQQNITINIISIDEDWVTISANSRANLPVSILPGQLAYVIYTSGSTGKPKGVLIEHGNVYAFICWCRDEFRGSPFNIVYAGTSYCFDLSVFEFFYPLSIGKTIRIIESGLEIENYLHLDKLVMINTVPAVVRNLLSDETDLSNVSVINMAGEPIPAEVVRSLDTDRIEVRNLYGPTEDTTYSTVYRLKNELPITIGKPIANTTIYIFDKEGGLAPAGVPGELCLAGAGVARGYLNQSALTEEKFIKNPFTKNEGDRIYKTGDLAKWLPDGNLDYIGRIDNQVKIRGYRIELGEVETAMNKLEEVTTSCVVTRKDASAAVSLIGYYVPDRQMIKVKELELYTQMVAGWKELYETEYIKTEVNDDVDHEFNIIGWKDSFTGNPIPAKQMKEWLKDITRTVLARDPGHVLEIGSGTGLVFFQLAGKVKKYIGTDFSQSSVNLVTDQVSKELRDYGEAEFHVAAAHEVTLKEGEQVDTVLMNSIVQYFPGEDYLTDVIGKSIDFLNGHGRIIIGDVRDNRLLELFKGRLQLQKMQESANVNEFKWVVQQETLKEEELCLAPEYFYQLQSKFPSITHVELKWKQVDFVNELSLYRYTVILFVGMHLPVIKPTWKNWDSFTGQQSVFQQLEKGEMVALKNVPNPKLWREQLLNKSLHDKSIRTVGDLLNTTKAAGTDSTAVNELLSAVVKKGYNYRLLLAEDIFKINVVFEPTHDPHFIEQPFNTAISHTSSVTANTPLFAEISLLLQKDVRLLLHQTLPDYMVPSELIALAQLPLNSNGKTDRAFLSQRQHKTTGDKITYTAPRNETEQVLVEIWQELLNIDRIGIYDNFFEMGGHSLLATRVSSAIRKKLKLEVAIRDLFTNPTIGALATHIQQASGKSLLPVMVASTRPGKIPLSFSQERLWFIDQLEGSLQYNLPTILKLKGNLNIEALSSVFKSIINRHEVLRTVFVEKGGMVYQEVKEGGDWKLTESNEYNNTQEKKEVQKVIQKLVLQPFDLSKDYMLRAHLIKLDQQEYLLVLTMHHIASDAWSLSVLVKEVAELYSANIQNRPAKLQPLTLQYADYAIWQRNVLQQNILNQKLAYWKGKLQDAPVLNLPTDYPRPLINTGNGAAISFAINAELKEVLEQLARQEGATLFMVLLAAFKVMLYRYTNQQDISVGTSISNRPQQEVEGLVGFFVNTLALRDQVNGEMSFTSLLHKVKATAMEAYEHQDVPFEKVVEMVVKDRDVNRSPLFQVMLVLLNTPEIVQLKLEDIELSGYDMEYQVAKFDFTFFITENINGLNGNIVYCTDLFAQATMERMIKHFMQLLRSAIKTPHLNIGKLPMLAPHEINFLSGNINRASVAYDKLATVVSVFEEKAEEVFDSNALQFEDTKLTYAQLNERSNRLARALQQKGVKPGVPVPLLMNRGIGMIVGLIGILKAGGAYVPIDPDFPEDRIRYMLEDTAGTLMVSDIAIMVPGIEIVSTSGHETASGENLDVKPAATDLAYIIYTSGSTGQPKGVQVTHANLLDYYFGLDKYTGVSQCKSFALVSTIATDLGNTVLYGALLSGGLLHVFTKESVNNIEYLHEYFNTEKIECLKIVPSHWKALSADDELLLPKKLLVFGGEALSHTIINQIRLSATNCRIINHYGPTETTIGKLLHEVTNNRMYADTIPIGKPFSNTHVYILTKELKLCPLGVPGQLYIAGDGVAKGYHNQPLLTIEKFVTDPFDKTGNKKMYGTGDIVKYLPDGNIAFIGRVDDQVKIRGYRIELGEIEAVLQQLEMVSQAVVLAKDDQQGNKRLVGYIVPKYSFEKEEILTALKEKLPEYMVPAILVHLESLPLTENGKVDRKALPDPEAMAGDGQYVAARNEVEAKLAAIWEEVLEVEQVGMHDDFFELGGHSLLAVRLVSAIRKAFTIEMPIGHIFDYPTVALLATQLDQQDDVAVMPVITKVQERPLRIPLSFSQERLWFIDQLTGSLQYHVPAVINLNGHVNVKALGNAIKHIVERHEVLRTIYQQHEGIPFQQIMLPDDWQLNISNNELLHESEESLQKHVQELIATPFDLSADYMLRATLICQSPTTYILVVVIHHIASDGWSRSVMVNDFAAFYQALDKGLSANLNPLPVQYADFAIWQRNYLQGDVLEQKINYWKTQLQGVSALQLPTDFQRPAKQSTKGSMATFLIDKKLADSLQTLSQQQGTTLFMTLLAAFKVLMYRYTGQEDICIGTPIAGRQQQEVEDLIGFFVNTLALRSSLNGEATFTKLLQQVRTGTLEAYAHQEAPFEKVVEAVVKERDMSRSPVFQVMFVLRNTPEVPDLVMESVELAPASYQHTTSLFDLTLFITETSAGLYGGFEYNTDLFRESSIQKMISHFTKLLSSIIESPQQKLGLLPMLAATEQEQLIRGFNATETDWPQTETVIGLFEIQAAKNPDVTALVFEEEKLSYRELNERSNQLAHYLQSMGVTKGDLIPVSIERSVDMIISVLAILKSGAVYVPVDPEYPAERIEYMLEDSGANIVISSSKSSVGLPASVGRKIIEVNGSDKSGIEKQSTENTGVQVDKDHLVYILYTSGSTGRPKGVRMGGHGMVNLLSWQQKQFSNKNRRVLQFASLNFDVSFQEIFSTLCFGSTLYLIDGDRRKDVAALLQDVERYQLTHLFFPYIVLKSLAEYILPFGTTALSVQEIIVAGEQLKLTDDIRTILEQTGIRLINQYGPTEAHVVSSYTIDPENDLPQLPPIGKPIDNTQLYILDALGQPVPVGVAGELFIGGVQVAKGYLNLPELTAAKFVKNIFSSDVESLLYKTGDLARWLPDGNIEYMGRLDDQVKIRGFRVELGEIESLLQSCPLVSQAVVLAKEDGNGSKRLVGYVVAEGAFDREGIIAHLKEKLPDYMVPGLLMPMEVLPVTNNGKINRNALPEPGADAFSQNAYVAPRNELEQGLVEIWQELLKIDRVGINDNFFEIGGHSLMVIRMVSFIKKRFNMAIPIPVLFQFPTISELGNYMDWENNDESEEDSSTFEVINI